LPLVGDFLSFNEIVATLNKQGHTFSFKRVPQEVFAGWFPGAKEIAEMLAYFEAHTYLGADSRDAIALATKSPADSRRSLPHGPRRTSRPGSSLKTGVL